MSSTGSYNWYLVFDTFLLGVASITENSFQTVDSGQVEDTRWSEASSDVEKVRLIIFGNWSNGAILLGSYVIKIIYRVCIS